jgi:hypothetical protein
MVGSHVFGKQARRGGGQGVPAPVPPVPCTVDCTPTEYFREYHDPKNG